MATQRPQQPQQAGSGPRPRILRIGVLLAGKLVEERLIRERTPVSIGQSMKNTFSIPIEGLPLEFTLFALDESRYSLRFLSKMDGRLSDAGGQVNTLDALKTKGAHNHGDYYQVALTDSARGKLSLGDLTILFQFVTEPPRQPKPMLPASVRGTFADRFDPQLSVIMGASIIAHFAIVIIALIGDVEKKGGIMETAYEATFNQDEYALDQDKPKVKPEAGEGAGSAAGPKKEEPKVQAPPKVVQNNPGPPSQGRPTENNKPTVSEEQGARLAELLTAGESADGKVNGDLSKRQPGGTLKQQAEDVKADGGKVAIGNPNGGKTRPGTTSGPGGSSGTKIDAPGGIASAGDGKKGETGPVGRITVGRPQTSDQSTLTADAVLAKINSAYMGGIQRCYKTYLNKDATAAGRVVLTLPINQSGRVVGGSASGFAGEVDGCISGLMGLWTFPPPKEKDDPKTSTEVQFQVTLQLLPT
ncbi:MAG: hypothetical protein KF773_01625 [Deltaproteobacteria bacterium]|nr:hypothetical protein [Deltaproteobacteria bacterium]MCW5800868.1 hypothetical protein [Deltaproteobacteria bacterium]